MGRALVAALGGLVLSVVLLAAPASSGNGIKMRHVRASCIPTCLGDRAPVWSPDGKTIAFVRRTRQVFPRAIFTVPANGGPARRVVASSLEALPDVIAWSPDSARLAYRTLTGANYVVPAAGGKPLAIAPPSTTGPVYSDGVPLWSPEGNRLAFVRQGPFSRYGPPPWCCQLWVTAADGSSATAVGGGPPPGEWLTEPAWSPDGRIAYVTGPRTAWGLPDYGRAEIWVSRADGSDRRKLVAATPEQTGIGQLKWSADGSRLAFVVEVGSRWDAQWVSSDGARAGGVGPINRGTWPRCCWFAPDVASALYTRLAPDGAMEVRLTNDVEDRRIADGISSQSGFWLTTASWSPDGERVTYVSDGECPTELAVHTVRTNGKDVRRLTRPCRIVGTHGPNRLRGTPRTDALYARGGNDRLDASAKPDFLQGGLGRDVLLGGPGDDRLYGGPGVDRLYAGPGWDAVYARDGAADIVRCGTGRDSVHADRHDRLARDCELVERE